MLKTTCERTHESFEVDADVQYNGPHKGMTGDYRLFALNRTLIGWLIGVPIPDLGRITENR